MNKKKRFTNIKNYERELTIAVGIVIMTIIFTIINPIFISWGNIKDIIDQATIYGLMALGMTFAIISGGIDLSVGSIVAIGAIICAMLINAGTSIAIAIIVSLIACGVLGVINGILITKMRIEAFVATLATLQLYRGVAYLATNGFPVTNMPDAFRDLIYGNIGLNLRSSILIFVVLAVITHIILKYTKTGNYVYAVGGNEDAAKLSGVSCDRTRIIGYTISGFCSGFAGLVLLAKLGTAEPTAATGYEVIAIAAVAVGGGSLSGGRGTIIGTMLGSIMLTGLKVGLVVSGVNPFWQFVATGLVIIVAVYMDVIQSNFSKSKIGRAANNTSTTVK